MRGEREKKKKGGRRRRREINRKILKWEGRE